MLRLFCCSLKKKEKEKKKADSFPVVSPSTAAAVSQFGYASARCTARACKGVCVWCVCVYVCVVYYNQVEGVCACVCVLPL